MVHTRDGLHIEKSGTADVTKFVGETHLSEYFVDSLFHIVRCALAANVRCGKKEHSH